MRNNVTLDLFHLYKTQKVRLNLAFKRTFNVAFEYVIVVNLVSNQYHGNFESLEYPAVMRFFRLPLLIPTLFLFYITPYNTLVFL